MAHRHHAVIAFRLNKRCRQPDSGPFFSGKALQK
jgi:hypothetical protein